MMNSTKKINYGLIGCGAFGLFCLEAISKMPEVKLVGVADIDETLARKTAQKFSIKYYNDAFHLMDDPEIEMVHLVTPPHNHHSLSMTALSNEKHVLCEKPLALTLADADEILKAAKDSGNILPVNFILRYVPVTDMIKRIIDSKILGEPIRAYFENYATDENLDPNHWFWDKEKSGVIFVEHGVHFFDLYQYWFGEARVIWAHTEKRLATQQEDRGFCFLRHNSGVLSNHYHGFDQPKIIDRQKHLLLFERGDIVVHGWIPEWFQVEALIDDSKIEAIEEIFTPTILPTTRKIDLSKGKIWARGKEISAVKLVHIEYRSGTNKLELYSQAIKNLIIDQISFIHNKKHHRIITEDNGRSALVLAISAKEIASHIFKSPEIKRNVFDN
jgi:predicted dehydrogenase